MKITHWFEYTHEETTSPEESWTSLWQTQSQRQIGPFTFNNRHYIVSNQLHIIIWNNSFKSDSPNQHNHSCREKRVQNSRSSKHTSWTKRSKFKESKEFKNVKEVKEFKNHILVFCLLLELQNTNSALKTSCVVLDLALR